MPTLISSPPQPRLVVARPTFQPLTSAPPAAPTPSPTLAPKATGYRHLFFLGWLLGILLAGPTPMPEVEYDPIHNPERFYPPDPFPQRYSYLVWRYNDGEL